MCRMICYSINMYPGGDREIRKITVGVSSGSVYSLFSKARSPSYCCAKGIILKYKVRRYMTMSFII